MVRIQEYFYILRLTSSVRLDPFCSAVLQIVLSRSLYRFFSMALRHLSVTDVLVRSVTDVLVLYRSAEIHFWEFDIVRKITILGCIAFDVAFCRR